ncbi:MAG: hypothetical protein SFX74_10220 [Fimbriimonadaceae bacterium]|nr:hypothetical protein [Fimbriimonadaceae bacterium]
MKLRTSTKMAIGFVVLVAGGTFLYNTVSDAMIMGEKFTPIKPGEVNIVGVDLGNSYRIITANYMAQLVQASSDFEGKDSESGGVTEGAIKKRIPVKELLQSLQGNQKALGAFVMSLNGMNEDDTWPTERVIWTAARLQKALDGDPKSVAELERDLNIRLDGTPLPRLNFDAMENGIIVESPVTVKVNIDGVETDVTGMVQEPYRPRIMKTVENRLKDKGNITREMQAGYYAEEAKRILDEPKGREIVRDALARLIDKKLAAERAVVPQRVLRSATVVVSDRFITGAKFREYPGPDGKPMYDMTITLTEEGRRRLWQFSKKRVGNQLLITAGGIPVAAPKIRHELAQSELTITQMLDQNLVQDAVNSINAKAGTP